MITGRHSCVRGSRWNDERFNSQCVQANPINVLQFVLGVVSLKSR
jgi:hypothetical protein